MSSAAPASQVFIVCDDLHGVSPGLSLGGNWTFEGLSEHGEVWFNNSVIGSQLGSIGSFTYSFHGTSIGIWGFASSGTFPFRVTIDDSAPQKLSENADAYKQWYGSPQLSDGLHTIKVDQLDDAWLDFMVITPSPTTPLSGQILMVDDSYDSIQYSNGWQSESNSTWEWDFSGDNFMNTTHKTSTVGATMTFLFTGTNAAVFGVISGTQDSSLSFTHTIDGSPSNHSDIAPSSAGDIPNSKLFDTGALSAGEHTLTLTLTDGILIIDYILYTPSFENLASMHTSNLTASLPLPTTTSSPSSPSSPSSRNSSDKINAGAIAGGVIGGVALLALATFLLIWWLKRRRSKKGTRPLTVASASEYPYFLDPDAVEAIDPFTPLVPNLSASRRLEESFPKHASSAPPVPSKREMLAAIQTFSDNTQRHRSDKASHLVLSEKPNFYKHIPTESDPSTSSSSSRDPAEPPTPVKSAYEQLQSWVDQLTAEMARLARTGTAPPPYESK